MNLKRIVSFILLSGLLQTCKPEEPLYNSSIKSISFAGIVQENVDLNQMLRTITITMPATITDFKLKSVIELTPHTKVENGLLPDGTLDLSHYCPCNDASITQIGQLAQTITLRNTDDNGLGTYLILLKAKNPLVIKTMNTPIEYSFDKPSLIFFDVENYYGNRGIYGISLVETGSDKYGFISADGGCMSVCDTSYQHINQVGISLDAYKPADLKPGNYDLRLRLAEGTVVKYPQPVVIK